jgi:copper chaperone
MALQLQVPSVVCDGCSDVITKAIQAIDAGASVQVNLDTKQITIDSQATEAQIRDVITSKGHTVA